MKNKRDIAIDLLKVFALFHMVYNHIFIFLYKNTGNTTLNFINNLIPICLALFVFTSGYSLTINSGYKKLKKRITFAFILMFISSLLFIVENGFQYPDFIFSSGILYTIGINLIIFTLMGNYIKNKIIFYPVILILSITIYITLRLLNLNIFHLITGYEPFLPVFIYGLFGFIYGYFDNEKLLKDKFKLFFFIINTVSFLVLSVIYGLFKPLFIEIGQFPFNRTYQSKYFFYNFFDKFHDNKVFNCYGIIKL